MKNHDKLAVVFAIVVIVAWIVAVVGSAIRRDYTALSIITPVVLTVAGWLFFRRNGKNGNGKEG
jgi:ATP/ADP translocase